VFADHLASIGNPVIEIGALAGIQPFADRSHTDHQHKFLKLLNLEASWFSWSLESEKGVKFCEQIRDFDRTLSPYGVICVPEDVKDSLLEGGYTNIGDQLSHSHDEFAAVMGLQHLLHHYGRILSDTRDNLPAGTTTISPSHAARILNSHYGALGDAALVIDDLSQTRLFEDIRRSGPIYERNDHEQTTKSTNLQHTYADHLKDLSARISVLYNSVQRHISDSLTVITSHEMMKLSRLTLTIAVIALVVSILSVFSDHWSAPIRTWLGACA
jgi:hypothetical protein